MSDPAAPAAAVTEARSLWDVLERARRAHGLRVAIRDGRRDVTYGELAHAAECIAEQVWRHLAERDAAERGAAERGAAEHDVAPPAPRVAILCTEDARWVAAFFVAARVGGVAVPLSELYPPAELSQSVDEARIDIVLATHETEPTARSIAGGRRVVVIDDCLSVKTTAAAEAPAAASLAAASGLGEPDPADPALVLFTSGTTGRPKRALISHANLLALGKLLIDDWGLSANDRLLHVLPLHHMHGLGIALLPMLMAGGTVQRQPRFEAERVWQALGDATVFMAVPTIHKKLLDAFDAADGDTQRRWAEHARNLRLLTSGSAKLPETLAERWRTLHGNIPLERFGMTEVGVALGNPLHGKRRLGSCGRPLPGMRVRIVSERVEDVGVGDEASRYRDVAAGEPGELWLAGPSVFLGYDDDEVATRGAFEGPWFKSGDTACWLDAHAASAPSEDFVEVLGRTSIDIIKSGGYKLSALEIEEVLRRHPRVLDAAVIGLPDETWGERVVAGVIARRPDAPSTSARQQDATGDPTSAVNASPTDFERAILDFVRTQLAPYKVPKALFVLHDFPRNPLGKVKKTDLADQLVQMAFGSSPDKLPSK